MQDSAASVGTEWAPGQIFGHFQIVSVLHDGADTITALARQPDGERVLLRRLPDERMDEHGVSRFRRGFHLARRVEHPHILSPQGIAIEQGVLYQTLPYTKTSTLAALLHQGTLETGQVLTMAIGLCQALEALHARNVIHSAVTPGHVLLNSDLSAGERPGEVFLTGFEAAVDDTSEEPLPGQQAELPVNMAYLAPEQTGRMARRVDYRADFYGLGATLYESLCGHAPFAGKDAAEAVHAHLARPVPNLIDLCPTVNPALAAVIHRLLSKDPESRYQTHAGLLRDLRDIDSAEARGEVLGTFIPATNDYPEHFQLAAHLYGRGQEIATIESAMAAVTAGACKVLLLSGPPGIGKTALVSKIRGKLLPVQANFISGKFSQFGQHPPHAAFISSLAQRARQILSQDAAAQHSWRARLNEALEGNVGVLAAAVPEFRLLLGETPDVLQLPSGQTEHRFLRCMRLAIEALLSSNEPLVLFIDDLQWADGASLRLLQALTSDDCLHHLLLVLAYRDDEVGAGHPFREILDALDSLSISVDRIVLGALVHADIVALLSEGLRQSPAAVEALADLCLQKTAGNPFFLRRFLEELYRLDLLRARRNAAGELVWEWSLADIESAPVADNVLGLMLGQLRELPEATRQLLMRAALLGPVFSADSLAAISNLPVDELLESLRPALSAQLLVAIASNQVQFAFAHDRIQEAALQLLPLEDRPQLHLSIGRQLLRTQSTIEFSAVNHLNQGRALITEPAERAQLCQANRQVAQRAMDAAAFELAANYADTALRDLSADSWQVAVDDVLELYVLAARAAALAGRGERMLTLIKEGLAGLPEDAFLAQARLLEVRVESCYASGELLQTLQLGQEALALLGIRSMVGRSPESMAQELALLRDRIAEMGLDAIAALPPMQSTAQLLQISIVAKMTAAAYIAKPELLPLLTLQQVEVMLENGHAPAALSAWSVLGLMIAEFLGDYHFGYQLGALSMEILDRHGWRQVFAHAGFSFNAFLRHWVEPLAATLPGLQEVLRNGQEFGNLRHAGLGLYVHDYHAFLSSTDLRALSQQLGEHAGVLSRIRQPVAADYQAVLRVLVAALRGENPRSSPFETANWSASELEASYRERNDQTGMFFLHTWRGLWAFLQRRYDDCLTESHAAAVFFPAGRGMHAVPEIVFMEAVSALRVASAANRQAASELAGSALQRFDRWAVVNPQAFASRLWLLRAESAHAQGQDAEGAYREAIKHAEASGNLLQQITAYTLQAEWQRSLALPAANASFAQARLLALQWGAEGIVDVDDRDVTRTAANPVDLSSLTKAVQLITGEISLPRLLEQLTKVLAENAGADHAAILLRPGAPVDDAAHWVVVADTARPEVLCNVPITEAVDQLPVALLHAVLLSAQTLLIEHVADDGEWALNPWLKRQGVRSVLCIPLLRQQQLIGAIYLGNSRVAGAFSDSGVRFLELLSGNIVNALENARLYQELSELASSLEVRVAERTRQLQASEQRLRSLLEHSPIPTTVATRTDGILIYANPAAAEFAGTTVDQLVGQPAVNYYRDPARRAELLVTYQETGRLRDEEVCLILRDHREHWVMVSMVPIDFGGEEADLATMVDITERKQMEKTLQALATTDSLTGLVNRRQLFTGLQREISRAQRHATPLALVMLDIDHFKNINDTWGHSAGDDMLKAIADVCRRVTRGEDIVARLGGEEFAIVMPMTDKEEALRLAERLRQRIGELTLVSAAGENIQCTASFGVAVLGAGDSPDQLLARADAALYRAKRAGRNCVLAEAQ
jgi:diguanylate cyclase (GGDEF)-like protein/PAS domain S-box-containing protein